MLGKEPLLLVEGWIETTRVASRTSCVRPRCQWMVRLADCGHTNPAVVSAGHDNHPRKRIAYLFITGELRVQDQPFYILRFLSLRMRCLLTPLDAKNHLAHDLELLPVDSRLVLTDECLVSFFCRNKIPAMQREEWDTLGKRVLPGKAVGAVASLGTHEDDKAHEVLLGLNGD